jgi:hypothetical protein
MLSRRINGHFHLVSFLVLVCVLAATLLGFTQSDSSLRRNNDLLLRQDANQAALLIDSYVPAILGNPPTQLGSLVTSIGVAPPAFLAAAAPLVKAGDSVALLHQIGQHFVVLVSAGTLHRRFDGPSDLAPSTSSWPSRFRPRVCTTSPAPAPHFQASTPPSTWDPTAPAI